MQWGGIVFLRTAMPRPFLVVMILFVRTLGARIIGATSWSEDAGNLISPGTARNWRRHPAGMGFCWSTALNWD